MTPTAARKYLSQVAAAGWLRKYRRGIKEHTEVPTSYILLKAKKKFLGARPIINYQSFPFGRLFRCTAFVLMAMMKDVFLHSFEMQHYHRCFLFSILFFPKLLLNITFSSLIKTLSVFSLRFLLTAYMMLFIGCFKGTRSYIAMMTT